MTLICRQQTADLINAEGTHRAVETCAMRASTRLIRSADHPGTVDAVTPEQARAEDYDLVALAMQEPQYGEPSVKALMQRIAASKRPCLSIMNMPPLAYLRRIEALADANLSGCYADPSRLERVLSPD